MYYVCIGCAILFVSQPSGGDAAQLPVSEPLCVPRQRPATLLHVLPPLHVLQTHADVRARA